MWPKCPYVLQGCSAPRSPTPPLRLPWIPGCSGVISRSRSWLELPVEGPSQRESQRSATREIIGRLANQVDLVWLGMRLSFLPLVGTSCLCYVLSHLVHLLYSHLLFLVLLSAAWCVCIFVPVSPIFEPRDTIKQQIVAPTLAHSVYTAPITTSPFLAA